VRLDKVSFTYGEMPFLFDVEFAASKITAIMGRAVREVDLLNLVAGFETPQSGPASVGADVGDSAPSARSVSTGVPGKLMLLAE